MPLNKLNININIHLVVNFLSFFFIIIIINNTIHYLYVTKLEKLLFKNTFN